MTGILAEFAAVYEPDFALINIFTVVVITAVAVACAISLRKKSDTTA
jgi:hypothetical protein